MKGLSRKQRRELLKRLEILRTGEIELFTGVVAGIGLAQVLPLAVQGLHSIATALGFVTQPVKIPRKLPVDLNELMPVPAGERARFFAAIGVRDAATAIRTGLEVALAILMTVGFIEFMYEEAIQAAMFGVFPLIRHKQWAAARDQANMVETLINKLDEFLGAWGKLNPFTFDAYNAYVEAARSYVKAIRTVIAAKEKKVEVPETPRRTDLATVMVKTIPARARIDVNGEFSGYFSPATLYLSEGTHDIVIRKKGYFIPPFPIEVKAGKAYLLEVDIPAKRVDLKAEVVAAPPGEVERVLLAPEVLPPPIPEEIKSMENAVIESLYRADGAMRIVERAIKAMTREAIARGIKYRKIAEGDIKEAEERFGRWYSEFVRAGIAERLSRYIREAKERFRKLSEELDRVAIEIERILPRPPVPYPVYEGEEIIIKEFMGLDEVRFLVKEVDPDKATLKVLTKPYVGREMMLGWGTIKAFMEIKKLTVV